jgi:lipopolysaccharide export system permease protein
VTILDRYITKELLKVFSVCAGGFVLVFLLVEITDKIKYYFQCNPTTWLMIKYFLVKIPGYLFYAVPLSILMGGMLGLFLMARHYEIIAMQANGIDALGIARPVLLTGLVASVLMFLANETVIPWSNRYSEYVQNVEICKKSDRTFFKMDQIWMRSPHFITHITKCYPSDNSLQGISIVRWNDQYEFVERLFADKAKWSNKEGWVLYGVNRTRREPDGRFKVDTLTQAPAPFHDRPKDFGRVQRLANEMNLVQLGAYIKKIVREGYRPTRYLVDWHNKIAYPLVCLIMSALSVPFAVRVRPSMGGVALGMAISVAIAFGYWIVHTMFIALGHGGYIPPVAAAWAANAIFGFSAGILLLQSGT